MRRGLCIGGSSSSLILVTNIHRQARASQWIWQYVDWPRERSKPMKIGLLTSLYNNTQLLTNEALDMMWYRPDNTNIDRGEAEVNIGILWSISHHIQCLYSQ